MGEKNIGVAVGDLQLKISHPLCVISSNSNEILKKTLVLLNEWSPVKVVYGSPFMKMEISMNLCQLLKNLHFLFLKNIIVNIFYKRDIKL